MLYIRCAGQYRNVTRACQKQVLEVWHGRNGKRLKLGMISMRQHSTKGSASGFRKISQGRLRQRVQVSAKYTEPGLKDMEERQSASVNDDDSCDWDEDWTLGRVHVYV